jgi:hypothetical protein
MLKLAKNRSEVRQMSQNWREYADTFKLMVKLNANVLFIWMGK